MNQNGYESQNIPGFGQTYNMQQGGYSPPVTGSYFASNQPAGSQGAASGYQIPQTGGYQPVFSGYQAPHTEGYQINTPGYPASSTGGYQAAVPGYQPPQYSGYQGAGYFSHMPSGSIYNAGQGSGYPGGTYIQPGYGSAAQGGYYGGQLNGSYPPFTGSGSGNGYASPGRPSMATGGSYIPPTPYSTGNTSPDQRQMQVGYQQGYNSISQMGRSSQTTTQKTASQQMPLNGGGYTPERVPVKRQPFEMKDMMLYAAGGILILLFVLAMFVVNSSALKILFILLAGGTTAALWVKPLTAENKRLCFSIVAIALCIAAVVSLIASSGKDHSGGNDTGGNSQNSGSVIQQQNPTSTPSMQVASGSGGSSTADIYGTGPDNSAEEDEATKQRLYLFLQYWNANRLDEMLTVCAPSWISKQESPKTALFQILKNRTPINFEIVDLKGTSQDKSRQIILKCEIDRHTGNKTVWYQLSVIMLKEGEQWYVDPLSIQTNEVEETPDPNVTPTPAPTPEPHYDANTVLYYNPDGGSMYHADPNCQIINQKYLPLKGHFTYGQINEGDYAKLEPCNVCNAPLR